MNKNLALVFIAFGCLYAASSSAAYLDKDGNVVVSGEMDGAGLLGSSAEGNQTHKKVKKSKK